MGFLARRRRESEWMDREDVDPAALERSLGFIRRVNRFLGYTRATIRHLERFSRGWKKGERIDIVDLATGSADVPRAILKWSDRKGFNVRIVGIDRHGVTARSGLKGSSDPRLSIVQADVFDLPFAPASFDYSLCSMFLHHLDEPQAVEVLTIMGSLARRGVIVADLLRHYRAYAWISLFTVFAHPMVRHDARVSVGQAFVKKEVLALRDRAGLNFARYYRHFGHRFVLAGRKLSDRT
jgi:SAM-dependent methyltransferase